MNNRKFYTCCFTGHRPSKISWKYHGRIGLWWLKLKIKYEIKKAIKQGYKYFISGMALGFDIYCAEIVINLRNKFNKIELECAIPCINQTEKWTLKDQVKYKLILSKADKISYVSNKSYFNGCMQKRNKYMVDNSDLMIVLFNGKNGGTYQTIQYAKNKNLKIKFIK